MPKGNNQVMSKERYNLSPIVETPLDTFESNSDDDDAFLISVGEIEVTRNHRSVVYHSGAFFCFLATLCMITATFFASVYHSYKSGDDFLWRESVYHGLSNLEKREYNVSEVFNKNKIYVDVVEGIESRENYDCLGDRLNNEFPLHAGEFICSRNNFYRFGMDSKGDLIWRDEAKNYTVTYFQGTKDCYFMIKSDGEFVVYNKKNEAVWSKECDKKSGIEGKMSFCKERRIRLPLFTSS